MCSTLVVRAQVGRARRKYCGRFVFAIGTHVCKSVPICDRHHVSRSRRAEPYCPAASHCTRAIERGPPNHGEFLDLPLSLVNIECIGHCRLRGTHHLDCPFSVSLALALALALVPTPSSDGRRTAAATYAATELEFWEYTVSPQTLRIY